MLITHTCRADQQVEFSGNGPEQAAARHALADAAALGEVCSPAVADAISVLGRRARQAGLSCDDLLAVVDDIVQGARLDDRPAPHTDALLLHLWRVAWRAYEHARAPAATASSGSPPSHRVC